MGRGPSTPMRRIAELLAAKTPMRRIAELLSEKAREERLAFCRLNQCAWQDEKAFRCQKAVIAQNASETSQDDDPDGDDELDYSVWADIDRRTKDVPAGAG